MLKGRRMQTSQPTSINNRVFLLFNAKVKQYQYLMILNLDPRVLDLDFSRTKFFSSLFKIFQSKRIIRP